MSGLMAVVTRTFVWLGVLCCLSLFGSFAVMTLLVDAPAVARWFLVSAALAGVCFLGAALTARHREG